ncbi:MAG: hypothetical protein ACREBR_01550 [bacterium]
MPRSTTTCTRLSTTNASATSQNYRTSLSPVKEALLGDVNENSFVDETAKRSLNSLCKQTIQTWKKARLDECTDVAELQLVAGAFRYELKQLVKRSQGDRDILNVANSRIEKLKEERDQQAKVQDITAFTDKVKTVILTQGVGMTIIFKIISFCMCKGENAW